MHKLIERHKEAGLRIYDGDTRMYAVRKLGPCHWRAYAQLRGRAYTAHFRQHIRLMTPRGELVFRPVFIEDFSTMCAAIAWLQEGRV